MISKNVSISISQIRFLYIFHKFADKNLSDLEKEKKLKVFKNFTGTE